MDIFLNILNYRYVYVTHRGLKLKIILTDVRKESAYQFFFQRFNHQHVFITIKIKSDTKSTTDFVVIHQVAHSNFEQCIHSGIKIYGTTGVWLIGCVEQTVVELCKNIVRGK